MGDENFDPCECVWGHELAMRRLLSLLRQSQSHCTDTECFVDGNTQAQPTVAPDYYIVMTIMMAVYFFLQFWLINNRRGRIAEPTKPSIDQNGGTPPNPPPTSS